jgi:uncharacterized protein YkwD
VLAKGGGEAGSSAYEQAPLQQPVTPLAAAGALLRSASFAAGLGVAPRDEVWTLIDALLAGTLGPRGAPPASGAGPPPPAPPGLSGPCDVPLDALVLTAPERSLLDQVNTYRQANGVAPLQLSASLEQAAAWKAANMVRRRYYGHDDSFRSQYQRLVDCGYTVLNPLYGENTTGGVSEAGATLRLWIADPLHNENLLNPAFVVVGVKGAAALSPADPISWVWVIDFGSVPDAPPVGGGAGQQ